MSNVRVINYKNASKAKVSNKRAGVYERPDGKGYILQFAKMNDDREDDATFCTSVVSRGVRYTTISLTDEATLCLLAAIMQRFKIKGGLSISEL
jgi:hypothetical protein